MIFMGFAQFWLWFLWWAQSDGNVDVQLGSHLRRAVRVSCEWAELGQQGVAQEEQAVRAKFVAEREARG